MTKIMRELLDAAATLQLEESAFRVLPPDEARPVFDRALATFTGGKDVRWWWERFPNTAESMWSENDAGFRHIGDLVPSPIERIWFVVEDDDAEFFPVIDTTPEVAQAVVAECFCFEYYLFSKAFSWLVAENHHGYLFAIGSPAVSNLKILRNERRVRIQG
jgi:hypothetical protein